MTVFVLRYPARVPLRSATDAIVLDSFDVAEVAGCSVELAAE